MVLKLLLKKKNTTSPVLPLVKKLIMVPRIDHKSHLLLNVLIMSMTARSVPVLFYYECQKCYGMTLQKINVMQCLKLMCARQIDVISDL